MRKRWIYLAIMVLLVAGGVVVVSPVCDHKAQLSSSGTDKD